MRVHGVDGLRVVDASTLRYVTNGNIYAPTMMVAEKSADLIRGNTPLPPIDGAVLPAPEGGGGRRRRLTGSAAPVERPRGPSVNRSVDSARSLIYNSAVERGAALGAPL